MAQSSGDVGAPVAFPNVAGDKAAAASGDTTHGLVGQSGYLADRHVLHKGGAHKGAGGPQGPGPQGPRGAHKGPRGPVHEGPGDRGIMAGPQGQGQSHITSRSP